MMEHYTLDPSKISLDRFFELTASRRMLPSRIALHDDMEKRRQVLKSSGISHLKDLIASLKTKDKLGDFVALTGLPEDYLLLLNREAKSYLARPKPLADFPGIPFEYIESLRAKGIKNTKQFFELFQDEGERKELARSTGIPEERLKEILALSDLARITGVGGVFARVVYASGIGSTRQFAYTRAREQYKRYMQVIEQFGYKAGHFVEEDINYCIAYAKVICETATTD
jgi:predicted flap endonuclease-1-like 5' DNA nuclease